MKKSKIILSALLILIIGIFVYSNTQILRGTDALIEKGKAVFPLMDGTADSLTYAGIIGNDDEVQVWFLSSDGSGGHDYWAMNCKITGRNAYRFVDWERPRPYTNDIVYTLWNGNQMVLINDKTCTAVEYRDNNDILIAVDTIKEDSLPYLYTMRDLVGTTTFMNTDGNPLF